MIQTFKILKLPFLLSFLVSMGIVFPYFCFQGSVHAKPKAYLIGPGDILDLQIYAGGEIQQQVELTVSGEGIINVPFIGPVKAKGLPPSRLEELITPPLARDYFVDPQVNIQIKEYHHLKYYISGAVTNPGLYESASEITLMELIAKAGGVLPTRGNVAYIQRPESKPTSNTNTSKEKDANNRILAVEPIKVDLGELLNKGDVAHNILLRPGDVVYIPLEKSLDLGISKIYVEGEVKRPGVYDYQPGITALNACIMAQGFTKFAAPNRARIIRRKGGEQVIIKINLNSVKTGKIADIILKPGDLIHIPETWL